MPSNTKNNFSVTQTVPKSASPIPKASQEMENNLFPDKKVAATKIAISQIPTTKVSAS
jgi:hypothetical protein